MHTPCAVIPETAKRLPGIQKAMQNKEVCVPVFAFGKTGMTTNYFRARGGRGRFSLRSRKLVQQKLGAPTQLLRRNISATHMDEHARKGP